MKRNFMLLTLLAGALTTVAFIVHTARAQDAAPRRIDVIANQFSFDPGEITLKKGQPVMLVLKSADVAHGIRFRELNVNVQVKAGGTEQVQFTPDKTGDFTGLCSVFCGSGHGSMNLKLHVVE
jgi:cytochrome c oxidase subunit 2